MFITYKNINLYLFICNTFCEAQSDDPQLLEILHLTDIQTKHAETKTLTTLTNTNVTYIKTVF